MKILWLFFVLSGLLVAFVQGPDMALVFLVGYLIFFGPIMCVIHALWLAFKWFKNPDGPPTPLWLILALVMPPSALAGWIMMGELLR